MTNLNIKVVSDAILQVAIFSQTARFTTYMVLPNDTFTVSWHPFYLDPSLPKTGIDRNVHLARKIEPERMEWATTYLSSLGTTEGINFSWQGKVGTARDAQRLVQLAKTKSSETEDRLVSTMFKVHFEERGDILSQDVLVAIGEKASLDKSEVKEWLDRGKGGQKVDQEVPEAYKKGIRGVPHFTIKRSIRAISTGSSEGMSC
ncbi:hypothetical protein MFIFM68171_07728 [Madurella fahalii]|uniref:DSBA-like thioredoxin domain-containing protein n=1 Tax=Madurella fahalii TaxID=1157608 RepID=A0ABQ0GIC8_9PEZI